MCRKISCNGADRWFLLNSTITMKCKSCDHDGHSNAFAYCRSYKSHRVGSRINFELKLNMYLLLLAGNDTRECGWFVRCNYTYQSVSPEGHTIRSEIQWLIECPSLSNSRSNAVARCTAVVARFGYRHWTIPNGSVYCSKSCAFPPCNLPNPFNFDYVNILKFLR